MSKAEPLPLVVERSQNILFATLFLEGVAFFIYMSICDSIYSAMNRAYIYGFGAYICYSCCTIYVQHIYEIVVEMQESAFWEYGLQPVKKNRLKLINPAIFNIFP